MSKSFLVKVDDDLARWFNEDFAPFYGAKQWFLNECLVTLKNLYDEGRIKSLSDISTEIVLHIERGNLNETPSDES